MKFTSEQMLTIPEIAELCQVSVRTVYRWVAEQGLPVIQIGGVTRVRPTDLEHFFQTHHSSGGTLPAPEVAPA